MPWVCEFALATYLPWSLGDPWMGLSHIQCQKKSSCALSSLPHPINPIFSAIWPPQPGCLKAYWTSEGYFLPAYLQTRLVPLCLYERGSSQPCLGQDNRFCPECVSSPRNCLAVCHCHHVLSSQPMCRISLFSQSL